MMRAMLVAAIAAGIASAVSAQEVRNHVEVEGARSNMLRGYGIVTGLNGRGDSPKGESARVLRNHLQNLLPPDATARNIEARNAALVLVTAELPPFQKKGTRLDVTVSLVGDAESLYGGDLQLTDLRGPLGRRDPVIYALASGRVVVQGDARRGNHTTGTVPGGAIVEAELEHRFVKEIAVRGSGREEERRKAFKLLLKRPDLSLASRLTRAINEGAATGPRGRFEPASTLDGGAIMVRIPTVDEWTRFTGAPPATDYTADPVRWLDRVLSRPFSLRVRETANVIINDVTKTLSWTGDVRLREGSVMLTVSGARPHVLHAEEGQSFSEFMEQSADFLDEQQQIDVVKALHGAGLIAAEVRSR